MKSERTVMGVFVCVLMVAFGVRGDDEAAVTRLADIVVRPERNVLLEPEQESVALTPAKVELTRDDLRIIKPATASAALMAAPGIHTETRGRKYKQFHSFRGQIYPYPDVALDGIWQRDAREIFYVYPGAAIERIEIMRSASALFYGLTDVVGVIDLRPRRPVPGAEVPRAYELGAEAGELGTYRVYGLGDVSFDETRAANFGAQYYRTDGRSGRNAAEELYSAFGSVVLQSDPDHRFQIGAWALHGYRELEKPDPDGPAQRSLKNREERYDPMTYGHVNLRGFHQWSEGLSTDWKMFYSDRQARYKRVKLDPDGPGPGDTIEDEDDREYGAQVIQALALTPDNTMRVGLFVHRWTAPNGKHSYVGSRQDVSSYALVLSDEQRLGAWTLDAGIRYARSYFHDFSNPDFDITGQSTTAKSVQKEWDDHVLAGTMGAALALDESNRIYAHGGVGQRRPGPGAVKSDGSSPDTETRFTADGGWVMSWGAGDSGQLKIGGFGVWRQDAIVRVNEIGTDEEGNEFYFSGNQDIRQQGVEVEVQTPAVWGERLSFMSSVTVMRSETREDGSYAKYREVPSLNILGGVRLAEGIWDASLWTRHVDRYENFRFAQGGEYQDLGDYWDVTFTGGVSLGRERNTRLYGMVENLLDENYSTVVGWTDPGRRFRVGVETTF